METNKDPRSVGEFGLTGAVLGIVVAVILISLTLIQPFSGPVNGFVVRLTLRLCPLFVLGFGLKSWFGLIATVLLSNAALYGAAFAIVGILVSAIRRVRGGKILP